VAPEPVAVAFANTRSSITRDRISSLGSWRTWIEGWPGLRPPGRRVDSVGLLELRLLRDAVQLLLRASAEGGAFDRTQIARLLELTRSIPGPDLRWSAGRMAIVVPPGVTPAATIANHLANAALDLLVTGPPLAACKGHDCLKLFVATRPDRRWCDGTVCGNRARVAAHSRRHGPAKSASDARSGGAVGGAPMALPEIEWLTLGITASADGGQRWRRTAGSLE
jgi:predicted RNA-binding Zn ribbon-like protein